MYALHPDVTFSISYWEYILQHLIMLNIYLYENAI